MSSAPKGPFVITLKSSPQSCHWQVAILTNSDQGQTLASTQRTGEEVAAVWLHYLRQEQKCCFYSDRTGHIPFPWCSWDTSPATFTWLETANEGLSSVP